MFIHDIEKIEIVKQLRIDDKEVIKIVLTDNSKQETTITIFSRFYAIEKRIDLKPTNLKDIVGNN